MNVKLAQQIADDVERELPSLSRDDALYTVALLRQRAARRPLTAFETAVTEMLEADLCGATAERMADLLLRATRAWHAEVIAIGGMPPCD
jgi:hypothetical protein